MFTITTLVASADKRHVSKYWTYTSSLRRRYAGDLNQLPVNHWLDDPNARISIEADVQAADIIVCLVSEEWLTELEDWTDYQSGANILRQAILEKRAAKSGRIIPIILSPCSWHEEDALARLQSIPRRAVISKMSPDDAWYEVGKELDAVIKDLLQPTMQQPARIPVQATPKPTTRVAPSFCRRCGEPLPTNATYCQCGTAVATATVASYTPVPQPTVSNAYYTPTVPAARPVAKNPTVKDGLLVIYSTQDRQIAQQAMRILNGCGLHCIDCHDVTPDSRWRDVFLERVQSARGILFLLSADLMSEMVGRSETELTLANQHIDRQSTTTYAAVIRYCADDAFGCPQTYTGVDGKPIGSTKNKEESWLSLGQHLATML